MSEAHRSTDARRRRLEREAAAGDPRARHALFQDLKRTQEALWVDVEGDRHWITAVWTENWPERVASVHTEDPVEEGGGNSFILSEDESTAGHGVESIARHRAANEPRYVESMVGREAINLWLTGEPAYVAGNWYPSLEDWLTAHREYPEEFDHSGTQFDVDDYHPALPAALGFTPGVAYRGS